MRLAKKGKLYTSLEERYRVGHTVKSRTIASLGPVGGKGPSTRKAATKLYCDVLCANAFRFGTSRPRERYIIKARGA